MAATQFGFYFFIFSLGLYAFIAYRESRVIMTADDFFYFKEFRLNVISWTTANITLGTGLFYIFGGIHKVGILFVFAPLSVLVGYLLLGVYTRRILPAKIWESNNLLAGLSLYLHEEVTSKMRFDVLISFVMVAVYTLLLSLEVYASSKLISICVFNSSSILTELVVAVAMLMCSVVYTVTGGFRATVSTDNVQFIFICLFAVFIAYVFVGAVVTPGVVYRPQNLIHFNMETILFTVTMSLGAISTQFYSILNLNAAMQVCDSSRQPLFRHVGVLSFVILGSFVVFALLYSGVGNPQEFFINFLTSVSAKTDVKSYVELSLLVLGMTAIVMSTIDSLLISITKLIYDSTLRWQVSCDEEGAKLKRIRTRTLVAFGIVLVGIALFCATRPDMFSLCISIVSAMDVFPPMLILMGIMAKKDILYRLNVKVFGAPLYIVYFLLWSFFATAAVILGVTGSAFLMYISVSALLVSTVLSVILYFVLSKEVNCVNI